MAKGEGELGGGEPSPEGRRSYSEGSQTQRKLREMKKGKTENGSSHEKWTPRFALTHSWPKLIKVP